MKRISRAKSLIAKKNDEQFNDQALTYMPRWAWACCAILIATSLSIRQVGLDITTPLNRIMTAHAVRIEAEVKYKESLSIEEIESLKQRVYQLEKYSHAPRQSKIPSKVTD